MAFLAGGSCFWFYLRKGRFDVTRKGHVRIALENVFEHLGRGFGLSAFFPEDLAALSNAGEYVDKYPGTHLFKEGVDATAAYVIQKGEVELYRTRAEGRRVVARVGAGATIGDIAMFQDQPYISSARAVDTVHPSKEGRSMTHSCCIGTNLPWLASNTESTVLLSVAL